MTTRRGWIGVDLDATVAYHVSGSKDWDPDVVGPPIPKMVERIKKYIEDGVEVRIFTARADRKPSVAAIERWCGEVFGKVLPVTNQKDYQMVLLYDDRAVQVIPNTGEIVVPEEKLMKRITRLQDSLDLAWGIIANASESDWSKQTPEWQAAARRWFADRYSPLTLKGESA